MNIHNYKSIVRTLSLLLLVTAGATTATAQAQDKGTVRLAYVEWSDAVASINVVRAVLEKTGYEVELVSLSAAAMWQSLATQDTDAITTAWLPTTHAGYYERIGEQVDDLGVNLDGTKLGLVVPEYSQLDSISDIQAHRDELDRQIVGIDPGAGIMGLTEDAVSAYDLDVNIQSGSGATMTSALRTAVNNQEEIVITGWTPHWKFARWDLKYLEDPKNVFGGAEQIHTIARQGLEKDMPEAYAILDNFEWTPKELGEVMLMNQEDGTDPYENAKQWVEDNPQIVNEWLPK